MVFVIDNDYSLDDIKPFAWVGVAMLVDYSLGVAV